MIFQLLNTLKDFAWDANYIYIIMDYYGGGDLSRFIKSRSVLAEDVARKFLQQLALALRDSSTLHHVSSIFGIVLQHIELAHRISSDRKTRAQWLQARSMAQEKMLQGKGELNSVRQ